MTRTGIASRKGFNRPLAVKAFTVPPARNNPSELEPAGSMDTERCRRSKKHNSRQGKVEALLRNAYTDKKTGRRRLAFALRVHRRIADTESLKQVEARVALSLCAKYGVSLCRKNVGIEIALLA